MRYDGWCRRIDLNFRAKYPYLSTRIFRLNEYKYQICVIEKVDNFSEIVRIFNDEIRFITAPIDLVENGPASFQEELECISDLDIPCGFEGMPLTKYQIYNFFASKYPGFEISSIFENHADKTITIEFSGVQPKGDLVKIQNVADSLKGIYSFLVKDGGAGSADLKPKDIIFTIVSSQSMRNLNCPFLERDENLWFDNVEDIYKGVFEKKDLYFFNPKKNSCLVNFSKFQNANLRNHLLLYDVVYCVLPLADGMDKFLSDQKITKEEILNLIEHDRLVILNMQPEVRLDYGFLREAFQVNPKSVVSRRALSALCAIDLVGMNSAYIFSDPEVAKLTLPFIKEISTLTKKDVDFISDFLLWPKKALRYSLDTLNEAGPMGIARYGVNGPIIKSIPNSDKAAREAIEFEFMVNSDQIHLAHALDATYFPFFVEGERYSDHPYALMMGGALNFFRSASFQGLSQATRIKCQNNPSIDLISLFKINEYVPISEFEAEISSAVIRAGVNSLFSELSQLDAGERNDRIAQYNLEVEGASKKRSWTRAFLDLSGEVLGEFVPYLSAGVKLTEAATRRGMDRYPAIQALSEYIEDKTTSSSAIKRHVSVLSKINRVARLKEV